MIAVFIGICLYELLSILPEYLSADFPLDWFSIAWLFALKLVVILVISYFILKLSVKRGIAK
jgi:hypothetical protein